MSGARPGSVLVAGSTRAWRAFPGQCGIRGSGGSAGALPGITATACRCQRSRPIASRCDASRNARGAGGTPAVTLRSSGSPVAKGPRRSRRSPARPPLTPTRLYRVRRPRDARMPLRPHRKRFGSFPRVTPRARGGPRGMPRTSAQAPIWGHRDRRASALLDTCA